MKVLDEAGKGVVVGSSLDLEALGLPVTSGHPTLVVFWKRQ
ncbi:MAG: hypothetical protein WEB90_07765 [Gemmatimonadota bacterium]